MGRPLNKKYFGNTNLQSVAGEGVTTVAVSGVFDGKTPGTYDIPASVISAPQITGGAKPTLTITFATASTATVAIVTAGSGYTSAPTISGAALQALGGAGTGTVILTAALTSNRQNGIKFEAQVGAGSEVTTGDIIRQVSTNRYKVQTSDGTATCKLVASADLGENEMSITATDANSNAYWVTKLTAHKATLTRKVSGDGDYATGQAAPWKFDIAAGVYVQIENQ